MRSVQSGRSIDDGEQFWYLIANLIREYFPINGVPADIVIELKSLIDSAELLRKQGEEFLRHPDLMDIDDNA